MKLVNEKMKNAGFNIAGKVVKTDANGIIEIKDKEVAKILIATAGFAPLKKDQSLDVEPELKSQVIEEEEQVQELEESPKDLSDEEAEALADKEAEEALLKEKQKQEEEKKSKWLPGKNNKRKKAG
jgi:superfamily I DNA/RNA helicase